MEQSVVVSSDQIGKSMGEEGKVVFYGIYFDTDKATLKAESAPTLVEMAKWLKANAGTKRSSSSATPTCRDQSNATRNYPVIAPQCAVIAALTKEHGVKADRMAAEGVGPLAPVANNADEAGRAKNRRVEMVLRRCPARGACRLGAGRE